MPFNPNFPYNDLALLPPDFDFDDIEILKKVNKANIALSRLSGEAKSIPNREVLIEPLTFREAVASSEIENINTTIDEAFQATYFDEIDLKKEQKETRSYRESLLLGYKEIKSRGFLNTNSYIAIQSHLEPTKPGIRKIPVSIKNDSTGQVLYTPPTGEDLIRTLLSNLEKYFNDFSDDVDALIKMAVLHYQFESIHPFLDGNGRTGRILMVLHLCLAKRLELPILFISGYINQHRAEYYKLLKDVTTNKNWKDWILFILDAVEEQSIKTSQSVSGIRNLMRDYRDLISVKLPKIYSAELVEYLFSYSFYSQSSLQNKLNIASRNTASKYFSELINLGILSEQKYKNDKVYFCPDFQNLLK
jgi:Fic family protein